MTNERVGIRGEAEGTGARARVVVVVSEADAKRLLAGDRAALELVEQGRAAGMKRILLGPQVPEELATALERAGATVERADRDVKPANVLGPNGLELPPSTPDRRCGPCNACCTVLGVRNVPGVGTGPDEEPGMKMPGDRCAHQSASGCGIYADRPDACRTYRCAWLEGQWGDGERPDRLGVLFDAAKGAVMAREVFRGGFERRRAKARLLELHRLGLHVRLVPFKGRKLPVGKPL